MRPTSYFSKSVTDQDKLLADAKKFLKQFEPYDAIVGTGLSGALAIPLIAHELKKRFCIVRKKGHSSHSSNTLEGNMNKLDRWVFVDDLIDSGETFVCVCDHMSEYSKPVGIYLYKRNEFITPNKVFEDRSWYISSYEIRKYQKKLRS